MGRKSKQARRRRQQAKKQAVASMDEYAQQAQQGCPADVRMISGCLDHQTSGDCGDQGGACTSSLLKAMSQGGRTSWFGMLSRMHKVLRADGQEQVPVLSTSREIDMHEPFEVISAGANRTRALLIGINYNGHTSGNLGGCHVDVVNMRQFLVDQGYDDSDDGMRVLLDHEDYDYPIKSNILDGLQWLVDGAQAGDTLFLHYSGHGTFVDDLDGDEEDGYDEAIVPLDAKRNGFIIDDELNLILVQGLPEGVQLTVMMDCCHSGTVLDLPYMLSATGDLITAAEAGTYDPKLAPNAGLSFDQLTALYVVLVGLTQEDPDCESDAAAMDAWAYDNAGMSYSTLLTVFTRAGVQALQDAGVKAGHLVLV